MIKIFSFLTRKDVLFDSLEQVEKNPFAYFQLIDEMSEDELEATLGDDSFYIEGGIHIEYNNKILMSFQEWDLLDQLWSYIINSLYKIIVNHNEEESFLFPDQPLKLTIRDCQTDLLMKVGNNKLLIPKRELVIELIVEAESCLKRIEGIFKNDDYEHEFKLIRELRVMYQIIT